MREVAERNQNDSDEKADPQWESFVRVLFTYDYLRKPSLLEPNLLADRLSRALYRESLGITAVAATVYMLAQRRAITSGVEKMTVGIIRSAAKDGQHLVGTMLEELRAGGSKDMPTDLFDVKQDPPERPREIPVQRLQASFNKELQSAQLPSYSDSAGTEFSSTKNELGIVNHKKAQRPRHSPHSYDDDDLRKRAGHPETPTSSKPNPSVLKPHKG
jgi:hypothetical protein